MCCITAREHQWLCGVVEVRKRYDCERLCVEHGISDGACLSIMHWADARSVASTLLMSQYQSS
jgi:hypothetical protein